ncbi:4'-phosphopantetheinyl transferase superfamily protein [Sporichthya sp.]|uniref:4'-phosphopantetheinyl transferase family protein n=1 Tax=Sporichthya sp. TaxID=65475 RepID=UPI0017D3F844|nr:4'-phosphopantetheinyl transferase superfamily protein [Sporichthya sp.]MBA3743356.1 4'-phosphopantetheinyl transferase superfamily protein [Sporichthya sp.]
MTFPEPLRLPTDEVHVWWAHARPRAAELLDFLDPIESTRHSALRRAADRDRFASAHVLARVVLAAYAPSYVDDVAIRATCKLCGADGHGKPALWDTDPPFTFSYAYAGARVGVAVARVPVGLDVVMMSDADEATRVAALAPAESAALSERPSPEWPHAVTLTWARKEALLKATGDGLSVPLADLVVSASDADPALVAWAGGPEIKHVQLADLAPGAGHVAALALITADAIYPEQNLPYTVMEFDGEPLLAAAAEPPSIA